MPTYRRALSSPFLQGVIRGFSERRISAAIAAHVNPVIDLPARPNQFIEFYLATPYAVSQSGAPPASAPAIALISPHTRPGTRLLLQGEVENFTVHFTPSGFHRLFRHELAGLADTAVHAEDVLNSSICDLRDQLAGHVTFEERVLQAEVFLGAALLRAREEDGVDKAMRNLVLARGNLSLGALARQANLSERQFTRVFARRSGISPRLFGRLVRFHALLTALDCKPQARLTHLAHEAGYFDQAHFIRDCHAFTGKAPRAHFQIGFIGETDGRFLQLSDRQWT
jgi:AraC-like DNA-binding protein